jgi:hypothetical protein
LSVEAIQDKLICVASVEVAIKFVGAVGGVVSGCGLEEELTKPAHPASNKLQAGTKTVK